MHLRTRSAGGSFDLMAIAKVKIGLIVDKSGIAAWQAKALESLEGPCEFIVYCCTTVATSRRSPSHFGYYILNLLALRNKLTARVPLPSTLNVSARIAFEAELDGQWQKIPDYVLQRIVQDDPVLMIKFGMGLLRVPSADRLRCPILSYHHGDPREFRGRPAGFYELMLGRDTVGQIIQILSNKLDAGEIVAFGETKSHKHSYRATMKEAYRCSPLLLRKAIQNVLAETTLPIKPTGKVYRLPSNWIVLRFWLKRLSELLRHLVYGAFFEKAWTVSEAPTSTGVLAMLTNFPEPAEWRSVEQTPAHVFFADPFYHPDGDGILVEALQRSSGLGEILHISATGARSVSGGGGHFSYPSTFSSEGEHYLLPEISEWSPARLFKLRGSQLEDMGELKIAGRPRLIDPTLYACGETIFLFANEASEGSSVLRLWYSGSLFGEFTEHPYSPICISPAGARMAGEIIASDGQQLRLGQDFRRQYGDGVILMRIDELSRTSYRETEVDQLRFSTSRGPHTLNVGRDFMVFDHYRDRFSLLAGARRLRAALQRQKIG